MRINAGAYAVAAAALVAACAFPARADDTTPYLEPGSLRLSHDLQLEGLFHRTVGGYRETDNKLNKTYAKTGDGNGPTTGDFGESLLTEAAARFSPSLFTRVLFELQGDYADRYWRPVNEEHRLDEQGRHAVIREAEAKYDRDDWYAHGFLGVGHDSWEGKGDFFGLYPAAYPDDDYLGQSGSFGIYPDRFKQDLFLNISGRHTPEGFEAGGQFFGVDAAVAYGSELAWGLQPSAYGRVGIPVGSGKVTAVARDERLPSSLDIRGEENHVRSSAVSYDLTTEAGNRWQAGAMYSPYRSGETYTIARSAAPGQGLLGSSTSIGTRKAKDSDGLAERLRMDRHADLFNREWSLMMDLLHEGILAGNKDQVELRLGADIVPTLHGSVHYTYRRPVEGPVPLLREGTLSNPGAIVSEPRGPESPFVVDWSNREAVFIVTTIAFDPTPGTSQLIYDPEILQAWNVNKGENAPIAFILQHRMSDYRTTTDRQTYINDTGDIVFDPPSTAGAWPTNGFIHEGRLLVHGHTRPANWILGVAVGEQLALSNVAYSNDARVNKPVSDYYSIEGRLNRNPFSIWGHYGTGVWGPEPVQRFFGESFDRLWGAGASWSITPNTTVDLSYLAARQDDNLFVAADLGSYDEWRMLFSHRFGFLFLFQEAARPGYRAQ